MTLGSWIGLGLLLAWGGRRLFAGYSSAPAMETLSPREVAILDAIADVLYPPGHGLAPSGADAGVTRYLDGYLGDGKPRQRVLVGLLLVLLEHATLLFPPLRAGGLGAFRRLSGLTAEAREAYLDGWEQSRWFPRRLCFTSLRALCTMGYFGDATVLRELGFAPRAIVPRIAEADLLYPRVGASRDTVALRESDLAPDAPRPPLGVSGDLAPDFDPPQAERS